MKKHWIPLLLGVGGSALCFAALAPQSVTIDGKVVTHRVKVIAGESWIPVSDLAKAQGLVVTSNGTSIDLTSPGGAEQVKGVTGKVGEMLFTGNWRIEVNSFQKAATYTIKNSTSTDYSVYHGIADLDDKVFTPKDGYDLYVASCTLKNARKTSVEFDWNPSDNKSAIADDAGSNNPWVVYDIPSPAFNSAPILPGAKLDFNICFVVKKDVKLTDIVLTLKALTDEKTQNVRIAANSGQ